MLVSRLLLCRSSWEDVGPEPARAPLHVGSVRVCPVARVLASREAAALVRWRRGGPARAEDVSQLTIGSHHCH